MASRLREHIPRAGYPPVGDPSPRGDASTILGGATRTASGAELDLLVVRGNRRLGFEFKRTDAPRMTPSGMRSALSDLHLGVLYVVHAGEHSFSLGEKIRAVPIGRLLDGIRRM